MAFWIDVATEDYILFNFGGIPPFNRLSSALKHSNGYQFRGIVIFNEIAEHSSSAE